MYSSEAHKEIFRSGSKTYFNSSVFFPPEVRDEVFVLYGFVRVADNYVDSVPQQAEGFARFKEQYLGARGGTPSGDVIIDSYIDLEKRAHFAPEWTDAFLHAMELDLHKSRYERIDETLEYVYGSAEVIGLFMARIMKLDPRADDAARMLGRAMQFINFIRDIDEDNGLGRTYLPLSETSLPDLTPGSAKANPEEFRSFIARQLSRYQQWQSEAEAGYSFIPHRYLVPIRTAGDMYNWTARTIERDPFVVFSRKVKPARLRILSQVLRNAVLRWPQRGANG